MAGRPDLSKFQMGCQVLENARVLQVGGVTRRAGLLFAGLQQNQDEDSRLKGFGFSSSQGVCLEFAHLQMNVFKNGVKIAGPFETPWKQSMIFQLDFSQRIDRIIVAHGDVPLHTIFRDTDTNWIIEEFPWDARVFEDTEQVGVTLTPSSTAGDISITSNSSLFSSAWVGQRLQLTHTQDEQTFPGTTTMTDTSGSDAVYGNSSVSNPSIGPSATDITAVSSTLVEGSWDFTTQGMWNGTFTIERSTDNGSSWTTIHTLNSSGSQNFSIPGNESPGAGILIRVQYNGTSAADFTFNYTSEISPAVPVGSGPSVEVVAAQRVLGDWSFETSETWTGTFTIERSYDDGTTFSPIKVLTSAEDKNFILAETEESDAQALIRVLYSGPGGAEYVFTIAPVDIPGEATITGVTRGTVVAATVNTPFIEAATTSIWKEEAFSPKNGYPKTSTFHQKRLFLGGSKARPQNVYSSRSRRPFDFTTGTLDDDGMIFELDSEGYESVLWLVSHLSLVVGTTSGVWAISAPDGRSLTPENNASSKQVKKAAFEGVPGIHVDENILFLQRKGRKVNELVGGSVEYGGYSSVDLTQLARQVTKLGVRQATAGELPDSTLYLNAGEEISILTYERPQNVVGWARWKTNGAFGSTATCPGAGEDDDVYFTVTRNGVKTIERLAPDMHRIEEANDVGNLVFLDSAVVLESEDPFSTMSGLDHLEGLEVEAFCDGEKRGKLTVVDGAVTFSKAYRKALVGLSYTSRIRSMHIDYGSLGSKSATYELRLRVENSLGGEVTQEGKKKSRIVYKQDRRSGNQPPSLISGDIEAFPHSTWKRGSSITIEHSEPLPFTLLAFKVKSKTTS